VTTAIVELYFKFIVGNIKSFTATINISTKFIRLILLLIVSNIVEHITIVKVAYKDRMDLAISVAIRSSI
jgi:Ca2+:H+ antiporter